MPAPAQGADLAPGSRAERPQPGGGAGGAGEPFWPAQVTVMVALLLDVTLPDRLTIGPAWLLPALEAGLVVGLAVTTPRRHHLEHRNRRRAALLMIGVVNVTNAVSLALLTHLLLHHGSPNPRALISAGAVIWLTNVLIFALWYWEIDRGGPGRRSYDGGGPADFLFQPMGDGLPYVPVDWMPAFSDYLFLSLSTATAFSAADTSPLTRHARILMGIQALVSLVTIGLVVSRAVNILN